MLAAIFAAVAAFQQILFCKYDVAFRAFIKVIGLNIGLTEKVVHSGCKGTILMVKYFDESSNGIETLPSWHELPTEDEIGHFRRWPTGPHAHSRDHQP